MKTKRQVLEERMERHRTSFRRAFADDAVDGETMDRLVADAFWDGYQAGESDGFRAKSE